MRPHFLRMESFKRGAALSSGLNFLGQGLGFVTSIVFAYYFGTGEDVDVYYYCLASIMLVAGSLNALNSAAIIPEALRLREQENLDTCMALLNWFLLAFTSLTLALTVAMSWDPVRALTAVTRFEPAALDRHRALVYWALPLLVTTMASQYLLDVLMAFRFFTMPTLFVLLNRAFVLGAVLWFHDSLGVVAALAGTLVANLLLLLVALHLMRATMAWDFARFRLPRGGRLWSYLGYCAAGQLASTAAAYVPQFLLSGLGAGILSSMNYAQRLAAMPATLLALPLISVVSIKLTEQHARREWDGLNRALLRTMNALAFLTVPICLFVALYAREIVQVLFQRGSFDATSTAHASLFLRFFILNVPLVVLSNVVARLFVASQRMDISFYYQIVINVLLIALMIEGVRRLGAAGYPLAQLVIGALNLLLLIPIQRRMYPYFRYADALRYLGHMLLYAAPPCAALAWLRPRLFPSSPWLALTAGAALFGLYWIALNVLRPLNADMVPGRISRIWRT